MSFDQSFHNQSSILSINIMVVDDDPIFLQIMSRRLEKSTYGDPSLMEITVLAAKNSMEALSTLKVQRNNIDLIVTDYYMPGMNGLQLKSEVTRRFGNLPVIVISSDANKEQESLTCGALCFIPKPIKAIDLTKIYQLALTYKRNGKSIAWTGYNLNNNIDHVVSVIPQQLKLCPDQVNVLTTNTKCLSRSDSRSINSTNDQSSVRIDVLRKNQKRRSNGNSNDHNVESLPQHTKKRKIKWTDFLHDRFLQAIRHIGLDKAVPKKILEYMNVPGLTRENVASHLQKYRIFLRKVAEQGSIHSSTLSDRDIELMYPNSHITELYYNYFKNSSSWYDKTLNDRSFYSRPRHGFGQSRLLSNTAHHEPLCSNFIPYNYMNRSSTYQPRYIGSNMTLPIKSNLNFTNQPSLNEGRRSFIEPPLMENKISQPSQVLGVGQHGQSSTHGNNFNNNMMSSYGSSSLDSPRLNNHGSLTINQQGCYNYGSSTLNQLGQGNYGSLTLNQLGGNNFGSLSFNQEGVDNYGSLTPHQSALTSYGSSPPTQSGLNNYGYSTPNQSGLSNYGSLTLDQLELSSYGNSTLIQPELTLNQLELSSYGNSTLIQPELTLNQLELSNYESSTLNQPELSSYESLTPYQLELIINEENLTPNQPGSSHFSYGSQSFLNNENAAYKPQAQANATTQPSFEVPQLEDLNLYGDLGNINELPCNTSNFQFDHNKVNDLPYNTSNFQLDHNMVNELPCDISNFQFDHNKQQGEVMTSTTDFELPPNFSTELNEIFSLEKDGDWTFDNINEVHTSGEMSNTFAAPETNPITFNMNPNHNQEQDVPDFTDDWSFLDQQDLVDEDFMNSLFNDMN